MNVNAGHERTSKARIIHQIQLIRGITTKRYYLLTINSPAFLNTFLYYKSSHPARRTSHIIILFSRFV
ncbi:hypothetical protein [Shigella dysenteriae]|uniref:hypothetical protein n=1 Tax=Shigella dysenteriae TaxID=622 RepID=UPI001493A30A|nr:hypothetical protein [Shigella dysenteriae]